MYERRELSVSFCIQLKESHGELLNGAVCSQQWAVILHIHRSSCGPPGGPTRDRDSAC
jgi:hypothetical protein